MPCPLFRNTANSGGIGVGLVLIACSSTTVPIGELASQGAPETASAGSSGGGETAVLGPTGQAGRVPDAAATGSGMPIPIEPPPDCRPLSFTPMDKVDLLFVVDNSISMADKQELLAEAVPTLVARIVAPPCVDRSGAETSIEADDACPAGTTREYAPVTDLHIGVISSSLGGHGADLCSEASISFDPSQNDRAWLLPYVRDGLNSYDARGFLMWDSEQLADQQGTAQVDTLVQDLTNLIRAVGEAGCGFEAPLEAMYRFLIDPEPPEEVVVDMTTSVASVVGIDEAILAQRDQFLRPDSAVMVVLITDENDCSAIDGGAGWLTAFGEGFHMPPAAAACASDPNDPCCRSCSMSSREEASGPPSGCEPLDADPGCTRMTLAQKDDPLNLRCFHQKQRFGLDLLYPTQRYVDGLRQCQIKDRSGNWVENSLFSGERSPSQVVVTAITGVPYQDVGPGRVVGEPYEVLSAVELEELDRWSLMVGDPSRGDPPTDPFMLESVEPRTGSHPLTGDAIHSADSEDPKANSINGHESLLVGNDSNDLQYACIFELQEPRDCVDDDGNDVQGCDCGNDDRSKNKPLCQPPSGGPVETIQYFAKAYPGLRQLEVLKRLEQNVVVGSVCPANLSDPNRLDYGYEPVARAAARQLGRLLRPPVP